MLASGSHGGVDKVSRELELSGHIMYRGALTHYISGIRAILSRSELLTARDIKIALEALDSGDPC